MSLSFVVGKIIFRNTFFHISHKHTCIFLNCYHELDQGIYQGPVISNTCINTGTSINVLYMYICFTHMLAVTLLVFTKCHPNKYSELADSFSKTIFPKIPVFPQFFLLICLFSLSSGTLPTVSTQHVPLYEQCYTKSYFPG